jgi:hypothetical protein
MIGLQSTRCENDFLNIDARPAQFYQNRFVAELAMSWAGSGVISEGIPTCHRAEGDMRHAMPPYCLVAETASSDIGANDFGVAQPGR